jgi:hypothetical protein
LEERRSRGVGEERREVEERRREKGEGRRRREEKEETRPLTTLLAVVPPSPFVHTSVTDPRCSPPPSSSPLAGEEGDPSSASLDSTTTQVITPLGCRPSCYVCH